MIDNIECDSQGRIWACSDAYGYPNFVDGIWQIDTASQSSLAIKAKEIKRIATAPLGAEMTGSKMHASGKYMFVAVQHPLTLKGGSFPDFDEKKQARSSVVVISRKDGSVL